MRVTLGKKLGFGFGVILALMVFSAAMAYLQAASIRQSQNATFELRFPSIKASRSLQRDLNQTANKGRQTLLSAGEQTRKDEAKKSFDEAWDDVATDVAAMDALAPKWTLQANRDRLQDIKRELAGLRAVQETAMTHSGSGERDALAKAGDEFADHATSSLDVIKKILSAMEDSFVKLLDQNQEDIARANRALNLTMALSTLAALGIGISVAVFLSRGITTATQSILAQAEAIAEGDLTRNDLQVRSRDELGDLTEAINKMSSSLKRMILSITQNAVQVWRRK
jgi:methyl-accepting chemotaxis protein